VVNRIGFDRLKIYLQEEMQHRYRAAIPTLVKRLEVHRVESARKIDVLRNTLEGTDTEKVKQFAGEITARFASKIIMLMSGLHSKVTTQYRQTLQEEIAEAGSVDDWKFRLFSPFSLLKFVSESVFGSSMSLIDIPELAECIINKDIRLHGGAQYLRLLSEFEISMRRKELPSLDKEELINLKATRADDGRPTDWKEVVRLYFALIHFFFFFFFFLCYFFP